MMSTWRMVPCLLAVLLSVAGEAAAQPPTMGEGRAAVSVQWSQDAYLPGQRGALAVIFDIQPRWHIYGGRGTPDAPDGYIPTTIDITWPEGWTPGAMRWPAVHTVLFGPPGSQESLKVFEGRTVVVVPFAVGDSVSPGTAVVAVRAGYQACDDQVCEMPRTDTVDETVRVAPSGTALNANPDPALAALFAAALEGDGPATEGASETAEPTSAQSGGPSTAPATSGAAASPRKFFGIPLPQPGGTANLALLALLSALGGFILNLTPCVLPVIPIKIMTILQHAGHPGRTFMLGVWMALGVIAFWAGIGLPVAFISGVGDPSRIFGIWWLTLGIGLLIALMGAGVMGLFTIQLPQSVYAVNPRADTAWGSFLFGVMTAVLGLPCFGFVAGALLVGVAAMPSGTIMTIFTSLGVGMALPYLVLSARPSLLASIPRTGPASELVKQIMGLLLLAAAAYFVGSGLIALVNEHPYLARQLHWWTVALLGAVAGLWLIVRTFQITPRTGPRLFFTAAGLVIGSAAAIYAIDATGKARADWEIHQKALAESGGAAYVHGVWNNWTPAAFEKARADGHIVVLDFTAEWCLNCKIIKAAVLNKDPVRTELNSDDVVKFTVDNTSTTAPGWKFMADLGQSGIPLLAIYTPGRDDPWLSNAYTAQQVMDAIAAARSNRIARGEP